MKKAFSEYLFVLITVLFGLAATLGLVVGEHRMAEFSVREHFRVAATDRINMISRALNDNISVSHSVVSFFESSAEVTREEFTRFTSQLRSDYPYIEALEWAPQVMKNERSAYEKDARKIIPEFTFNDIGPGGELVPSGERDRYFPLYFLEPLSDNIIHALGTDFMTSPIRRRAMELAIATGQTTATAKVTLISSHRPGILFFSPVTKKGIFSGFIISVIPLADFVSKAIEPLTKEGVNIIAYDVTESESSKEPLFIHSSRLKPATDQEVLAIYQNARLRHNIDLDVGQRRWQITIVPSDGYFKTSEESNSLLIIMIGCAFTSMLAFYMISRIRENIRITHEVELRTAELERMARFDILTGLANRRLFMELLEKSVSRAKRIKMRVGVIYMDLNNFKPVNDEMGHAAGDALLKEFAARINRVLRQHDTAARLGGDEFAVIMDDVHTPLDCEAFLARLMSALMQNFTYEGKPLTISASIGVALFPDNATTIDELVARADGAMYDAKKDKSKPYLFSRAGLQSIPAQQPSQS